MRNWKFGARSFGCGPALERLQYQHMVGIEPLRIDIDREEDGRFLASIPDLPGVMAYDVSQEGAIRKAKSIALQVLADMIESGEEVAQTGRGRDLGDAGETVYTCG